MTMKCSVIVPVHNAENTIEKCVESILNQRNCFIELILVENASDDNSYQICLTLAQRKNNIVLIRTPVKGASYARNLGLMASTGDVIAFCDADDEYEPNVMENVLATFYETNADLIVTAYCVKEPGKCFMKTLGEDRFISYVELAGRILNDARVHGSVWNKFYKKV